MLRFFRLVALLAFMVATTALTARLVGGMRPRSPLLTVMTGSDGAPCDYPCLFGIKPGKTTIQQAVLLLHSHPLTHDAEWLNDNTLKLVGPDAYIAFSRTRDGLVDSITFTDNLVDSGIPVPASLADSITFGDLIANFGVPIVGIPGSAYFVVDFPAAGIMAASARSVDFKIHVLPGTQASMVMVYVVRPCPTDRSIFVEFRPWIGFKTVEQYIFENGRIKLWQRSSGVPLPPFATCQE